MKSSDTPAGRGLGSRMRRACRALHRDLSFFFAGMTVIYAVSGIAMNHRDKINPHYSVERSEFDVPAGCCLSAEMGKADICALLSPLGEEQNYTKHYFPQDRALKVFLKGGSSLEVDIASRRAVYEKLTRRPLLGSFARLHYNPGAWWTYFADIFACALIVITITGLMILPGRNGLAGRGGAELAAGIAVPLLFLLM